MIGRGVEPKTWGVILLRTMGYSRGDGARGVDVQQFLVRPWPRERHPKGAAHMTEYVSTRHQLMIILVILSSVYE